MTCLAYGEDMVLLAVGFLQQRLDDEDTFQKLSSMEDFHALMVRFSKYYSFLFPRMLIL